VPIASRLLLTFLVAQPSADAVDEVAPLGSAMVADFGGSAPEVRAATVAAKAYPWLPFCAYLSRPVGDAERIELLTGLPDRRIVVVPRHDGDRDAACIAAIRREPAPPAMALARYVAERLGYPDLVQVLESAIALMPGTHRSTISRRLSRYTHLRASDWRKIHLLCRALPAGAPNAAEAAFAIAMDPRTLRKYLAQYLGVPYADAKARLGWRWIPELVLRRAGMVGASAAGGRMEA
jgi:hypothetical protein